jgi:tRNA A37 threonylcarbamoyladenosine dehydratase
MKTFDPHIHLKEIVLVGLGGTGAQIARSVARLAYDMGRARLHVPAVRFIDPDTVEEKNIGRQLFSYGDLGQNKARCLAARFNAALGLNIAAIDQPFDAERHVKHASSTLLIGAVDNDAVASHSFCTKTSREAPFFSKLMRQESHSCCANPA